MERMLRLAQTQHTLECLSLVCGTPPNKRLADDEPLQSNATRCRRRRRRRVVDVTHGEWRYGLQFFEQRDFHVRRCDDGSVHEKVDDTNMTATQHTY